MRVLIISAIVIFLSVLFPIIPAIIKVPRDCALPPCEEKMKIVFVKLPQIINFNHPFASWQNKF